MCGPYHCLGRDAFASGPEILRRLLQLRQNTSILEQGCAGFSPGSPNRCDQFTRHPGRTSSPLRPRLSCRYTQPPRASLRRRPQGPEEGKARAMTGILAAQPAELRTKGDALIRQADKLLCESWNERMWADGEPIDPSPTVDQAINGG